MQFKNKLYKIKANLKYKLAESFCRNFALQSGNIAKTILTISIESKEMNWSWCKIAFNIFCEAKKWKCSNLSGQKSWIAVKLWRDWSQEIASFLEIKTFSSHSLMDCAVKQCIQHAYHRRAGKIEKPNLKFWIPKWCYQWCEFSQRCEISLAKIPLDQIFM